MSEREPAVANGSARGVIRHEGREVVLVSEEDGALITRPASGVRIEEPADRSLYYGLVLEHAHGRAVAEGRILDVHDADPDRLVGLLTARDWQPLEDGRLNARASDSVDRPWAEVLKEQPAPGLRCRK